MSHLHKSTTSLLLLSSLPDLLVLQDHVLVHLHSTLKVDCYLGIGLICVFLLALLLLFYGLFSDLRLPLLLKVGVCGFLCAHLDYFLEELVNVLTGLC